MKMQTIELVQITIYWGLHTDPNRPSFVVKEFIAETLTAARQAAWTWRHSEEGRTAIWAAAAANVPQGQRYFTQCANV